MNATISQNEIAVTHTVCGDREFLSFPIPNGWDDVKPMVKKVLRYDGKTFTFSCWNSDNNTCHFVHIPGVTKVATVCKK